MAELELTHNNPLNNSTSKQQFSFNKTHRFKDRLKTEGADRYYDIPSTRAKVAFSFGKLDRCPDNKFVQGRHSPPPGSYRVEGDFQKMLKKKEGVKLMYGRDQCKSGGLFRRSDIPGPGAYNPNPELTSLKISRDLTLGKIHTNKRRVEEQPLPGPGAYQLRSLILNDNKILSQQTKNSFGKLFFPESKSMRIKTEAVVPQFRLPQITSKGDKMTKGVSGFSLGKSARFVLRVISDLPGPGAYNKFSEFVDSKKG